MKKKIRQVRREQQRLNRTRSPEYQAKLKLANINKHLNNRKTVKAEETFLTDQLDDELQLQRDSIMEKSLTRDPTLADVRPIQLETREEAEDEAPDTIMDDDPHSLFSGSQVPEKKNMESLELSLTQPSQFDISSL